MRWEAGEADIGGESVARGRGKRKRGALFQPSRGFRLFPQLRAESSAENQGRRTHFADAEKTGMTLPLEQRVAALVCEICGEKGIEMRKCTGWCSETLRNFVGDVPHTDTALLVEPIERSEGIVTHAAKDYIDRLDSAYCASFHLGTCVDGERVSCSNSSESRCAKPCAGRSRVGTG